MKRALLLAALLISAAGYVFLQTVPAGPKLATLMPGGALLYLEARDFGRLLRDWDASKVKADWLESENYEVFSRSNLFTKLAEVYGQYGEAAGFVPGLKNILEIAGTDSALALYEIRDAEFLYISRIGDADLMKSELWALRDKFEQRQAGGVSFYLRHDPASKRTVAFAFAKGYLVLATRDDLVAQSLELMAGGGNPNVASDRWYRDAVAAAPNSGELRLVMNLEALVKIVAFRSYWVQRNASVVRRYWAGVADVRRSTDNITETRVLLRVPEMAEPERAAVNSATPSDLLALVPPEAGLYKASAIGESSEAAALMVQKLIGPQTQRTRDWREAPMAISPDVHAGGEGDLETRIDEQPLPPDAGVSASETVARAMVDKGGARSVLLVQASSPAAGTFVQIGSVIVLAGTRDWDADSVRAALSAAAGKLLTTSQLGAGWANGTAGRHPVERLEGLATLMFTLRGRLLFLGSDSRLLGAVLDRVGSKPPAGALTYAGGFRHLRERPNFERVMTALDFVRPEGVGFGLGGGPAFFSGNMASLSRVLSQVAEVRVTEEERGAGTVQTVVYRLERP
jgi:hypothetical protein